jgi:DNA-binding HxlR family transcriptional regulator
MPGGGHSMYEAVRAVIGTKWTLEILELLSSGGPANFTEIESEFDTSPDVLAEKLQLLVEHELLERTERSSRDVRYSITEDGRQFLRTLDEFASILE